MSGKPNVPCVVSWSGGCDSTKLVDDWSKYVSEKSPLYVVSVSQNNIGSTKMKSEKACREKIKKHWAKEKRHIKYIDIDVNVVGTDVFRSQNSGLHQFNVWIGNIVPHLPPNSRLAFGYIKGDCFWNQKHHVLKVMEAMGGMSGNQNVKFEFPLEFESKADIINYLKEEGLYSKTWWCEDPEKVGVTCKNKKYWCTPCKTHDTALYEMQREKELSEKVKGKGLV